MVWNCPFRSIPTEQATYNPASFVYRPSTRHDLKFGVAGSLDHPPLLVIPDNNELGQLSTIEHGLASREAYQIKSVFLMVCLRPSWNLHMTVPSGFPK